MHSLICFQPKKHDFTVQANIMLGVHWIFEYKINGNFDDILFQNISGKRDLIWQHTCFEAFVAKKGDENYFEFNFSPKDAWAIYQFNSYRKPQPPKMVDLFNFIKIEFKHNYMLAEVKPKQIYKKNEKFDVALNAIIETKDEEKSYWSTFNFVKNPDFHLRESFNLKLEVT